MPQCGSNPRYQKVKSVPENRLVDTVRLWTNPDENSGLEHNEKMSAPSKDNTASEHQIKGVILSPDRSGTSAHHDSKTKS